MAKKIIVSDLDGTLLDNIDILSPKYSKRLDTLLEKGIDFNICTGRDYDNSMLSLKGVEKYNNPLILTNGAVMTDVNGNVLECLTIDHDESIEIVNLANDLSIKMMVFASVNQKNNHTRYIKGHWWDPNKIAPLENEKFEKFLQEPIISIQYCAKKEILDEMYNLTQNKYNDMHILYFEDAFLPGYYWLEYNPKDAMKEIMVDKLLKLKGYTSDDLIVFGDQFNDVGMLKLANIACVVNNAPDEVKEFADQIIPSNKEGGVIQFLEENIDMIL